MRVRAAHERHVQRAVELDVVQELGASGKDPLVLATADRPADRPRGAHDVEVICGKLWRAVKLRLYHHPDGARIAYREAGTGTRARAAALQGLTHREFEPVVDELAHRYRVVLPDLPLHGASEDRPTHPYSPDWLIELLAGFLLDTCGPRPLVAGHGLGAQLALLAIAAPASAGQARPAAEPDAHQARAQRAGAPGGVVVRAAVVPGRRPGARPHAALALRPSRGDKLTVTDEPGARDLVRHALMDLGGNGNRVRSWAKAARSWPRGAQKDLLDAYPGLTSRCCCCGPTRTRAPARDRRGGARPAARRAAARAPRTGFLIAYDDPVGVARELLAFCG